MSLSDAPCSPDYNLIEQEEIREEMALLLVTYGRKNACGPIELLLRGNYDRMNVQMVLDQEYRSKYQTVRYDSAIKVVTLSQPVLSPNNMEIKQLGLCRSLEKEECL